MGFVFDDESDPAGAEGSQGGASAFNSACGGLLVREWDKEKDKTSPGKKQHTYFSRQSRNPRADREVTALENEEEEEVPWGGRKQTEVENTAGQIDLGINPEYSRGNDDFGGGELRSEVQEGYFDFDFDARREFSLSRRYSSFIPPIPSMGLPSMIHADKGSEPQESEEETRRRIIEKLKQTKYYKQPASQFPDGPFYVRFLGLTNLSGASLLFKDVMTEKQYRNVQSNLKMYFSTGRGSKNIQMPAEEIDVGRIVLAKWEPRKYVRAWIIKVYQEPGMVDIRDCDEWIFKRVPIGDIYYMLSAFMNTPFRVQTCILKGLELWYGSVVLAEMLPLLNEVQPVMKVINCSSSPTENDGLPVMTLEVTDKKAKNIVDLTVNEMLKLVISGFTRIPKKFFKGMLLEKAHVSIAETDGEVWIQMHSGLAAKLCSLGENPRKCETYIPKSDDAVTEFESLYFDSNQKRFLARYLDDRAYYRVEVLEATRGGKEVKVQYLEFGNSEVIPVEDLLPVQAVDPTLGAIPMQVFRAYFNGIDEIIAADDFFDQIGVSTIQRFMVAGFREPNVPLLDAYAKLDPEKPDEWVLVNQLILDKGWAKGTGVHNPLPCGTPKSKSSEGKAIPKKSKKIAKLHEKKRYYTSCRVVTEEDGVYAFLIKNKQ